MPGPIMTRLNITHRRKWWTKWHDVKMMDLIPLRVPGTNRIKVHYNVSKNKKKW